MMTKSVRTRSQRLFSAAIAAGLLAGTALPAAPALADRRADSTTAYERAFALFNKEDFRAARIELLKSLKAEPNNPLARLLNARVMLELGGGVAAQTEIEKARAAGVPRDKTRHLMAHALMLQGKGQEALGEADSSLVPKQFAAYAARIRARAQMVAAQIERARGEFELASRLAPDDAGILIDRARFEMLSGNRDVAEQQIDRALSLRPTSARALVLKGDIVRSRAGLPASLPYFTQAVQADPNNIEALLERAGTLGDLRREAEARADLKKVDQIQPGHPLGLYLTAVLEARAGRFAQANALMSRTKGVLDGYPPALMLQGMVAYQLGNLKAADDFLTKVVNKSPDYMLARRLLAATQMKNNDFDGAIASLKPLVEGVAPDGSSLALMAQAYARKGDYKTAQGFYQRAAKAAPNSAELRTQLAMTQAASGDNSAALGNLNAVLKSGGDTPRALATLALVNLRSGKFADALSASSKLVAARPQLPIGYNMRGAAYLGLRNPKAAESDFRMAIAKDPKFNEARRNLGQLLLTAGRTAEAKKELLQIVNNDSRDARAMILLSAIAQRAGNSAERIQWLNQAATVDPKALAPRVALAQAYVQTGQANRGITTAQALERDFPSVPGVVELVGMANLAGRNYSAAESAFNRLIALIPNEMGARLLLARTQAAAKRPGDARRTYDNALLLPKQNLLPIYVDAIRLEMANNRPSEVAGLLARMRAAYPKSNIPDQLIGDDYARKGQTQLAIAAYDKARRINFDRTVATRLSSSYQDAGNPRQAIAVLRAYQQSAPTDLVVAAAIAELQIGLRQYKPAIATYEALLPKGGNRAPAILNNLAWAYHQVGDKRAAPTAQRALALAPASPEIKDTLGTILVDTRSDKVKGQALIREAVAARPRDPNIRYHLAVARVANSNPEDALKELDLALKAPRFDSRNGALVLQKRLRARLGR